MVVHGGAGGGTGMGNGVSNDEAHLSKCIVNMYEYKYEERPDDILAYERLVSHSADGDSAESPAHHD